GRLRLLLEPGAPAARVRRPGSVGVRRGARAPRAQFPVALRESLSSCPRNNQELTALVQSYGPLWAVRAGQPVRRPPRARTPGGRADGARHLSATTRKLRCSFPAAMRTMHTPPGKVRP